MFEDFKIPKHLDEPEERQRPKYELDPNCPKCFGIGMHAGTTFDGAMPPSGPDCSECWKRWEKKRKKHEE